MNRAHLVQRQRQFGVIGNRTASTHAGATAVDLGQQSRQIQMVALRRQAAVDGAGTHRHQGLATGAKLTQHLHVLGVAQAAFDQADVAGPKPLDVGQRRAIELHALDQFKNPLIDIKKGHVATKAACE